MCVECAPSNEQDSRLNEQEPGRGGSAALTRRGLLLGAAGLAATVGLVGDFGGMPRAYAAVTKPTIHPTATWGAKTPTETLEINDYKPTYILIHHTATGNSTDYSKEHAFALSRSIQNSHLGRGFPDTGQQFTVSRGGHITEGRHRSLETLATGDSFVFGAHVGGANAYCLGIEHEGTYTELLPPTALWDSMISLVAYLCQQYGVPVNNIRGHRDFNMTECPGHKLYPELAKIRADVAKKLGQAAPELVDNYQTLKEKVGGYRAKAMQGLLNQHGATLKPDGDFGAKSTAAVIAFQKANALVADGVCGPKTWAKLVVTVRPKDDNDAVLGLQVALTYRGFPLAADGSFGPATEKTLKAYQATRDLVTDGICGPKTWVSVLREV